METQLSTRVRDTLLARHEKALLRELRPPQPTAADFSSNDYLGLTHSPSFRAYLSNLLKGRNEASGSTGSRLLSGHSLHIEKVECLAADFHDADACLLFNSGYDANLSVLSCIPGSSDVILYDSLIHASVHDGMRMSRARASLLPFAHNNIGSFQEVLHHAIPKYPGSVIICVESVYSMDGDFAPVSKILNLAAKAQASTGREIYVIVDEAHGGGVYGENGEGYVFEHGLHRHPNLLARIVTFGKAFAAHGAVVLSSERVRQYLINYARPFIYSTALPPHSVVVIEAVYNYMRTKKARDARRALWNLVDHFYLKTRQLLPPENVMRTKGRSAIQGILVGGNKQCVSLANTLRERGFDVYPIRSPTVPSGKERIRIIIHAHNRKDEIERLVKATAYAIRDRTARARL